MSKRKNKNAFWRYTSNLKKKQIELKEINIPIDQLIDHYKKLFYVDDSNLNQKQTEIRQKLKNYTTGYIKPSKLHFFTFEQLRKSLTKLSNSPVKGFDQLSYQLIKKKITDASN